MQTASLCDMRPQSVAVGYYPMQAVSNLLHRNDTGMSQNGGRTLMSDDDEENVDAGKEEGIDDYDHNDL